MNIKPVLLTLVAILGFHQSGATNYYFSNQGNDKHDGRTKFTPWLNLIKIAQMNHFLQPGDSILLERGSKFNASIDYNGSGIYLGAYGKGEKPIISGSVEIKKWIRASNHLWKAKCIRCITEPGNLFMDGIVQPLGRYPDEGFLTISKASENGATLSDVTLPFLDNYWNEAEMVVRTSRWTLDILPVTSYSNRTFYTSVTSSQANGPSCWQRRHRRRVVHRLACNFRS